MTHLSELELRLAYRHLGIERSAIAGPPIAAIIGEAPGPNTSPKLPLFPIPARSAGGRLLAYSGMKVPDYLGTFARRNLFTVLAPWSTFEARSRAIEVLAWLRRSTPSVRRVLLLGSRVGAAFGLDDLWASGSTSEGIYLVTIPHPSGRNRVYNDPAMQARARAEIRWAAGKRRTRP